MKSKYEEYTTEQRIADLKTVLEVQCTKGNYDDEYMRGMANGLKLAWNIVVEPYGSEIVYIPSKPKVQS